jgi:hypothetical protein
MKRVCQLFVDLEFQFEMVLFEELKKQMILVYLKREAVNALSKELDMLISKNNRGNTSNISQAKLGDSDDLINKLKKINEAGVTKRVQGGVLRLDSKLFMFFSDLLLFCVMYYCICYV